MVGFCAAININNYEYNIQSAGAGMCQTRYNAAAGTSTYLRKSSGFYLAVVEPVMRNQNRLEELTD
jgi:hypothetical protein